MRSRDLGLVDDFSATAGRKIRTVVPTPTVHHLLKRVRIDLCYWQWLPQIEVQFNSVRLQLGSQHAGCRFYD